MSKRFLLTLLTIIVIGIAASVAVFLAKGYRLSPDTGTIAGTGIISVTSVPDQASVYLDGHLTTATDANINSLVPKSYEVKIVKEGYIPWEKKLDVKEGLVTEVKATLFRAIPSIYPLTYTGALKPILSPDGQKLLFIVPNQPEATATTISAKKSGLWVWTMSDQALNFQRGAEPHQVALTGNLDYTKATFRWSPDSSQILVSLPDRHLLIESNNLNDPPKDVTAVLNATTKAWDDNQKTAEIARVQSIKNINLRKEASESAYKKWSPDETKLFYSKDGKANFKVADLLANKTYDIPKASNYSWLGDSLHLLATEPTDPQSKQDPSSPFTPTKVSILEFDGTNKSEIYVGNLDPSSVFGWPDASRIVALSFFPTATASQPNLYGINLK